MAGKIWGSHGNNQCSVPEDLPGPAGRRPLPGQAPPRDAALGGDRTLPAEPAIYIVEDDDAVRDSLQVLMGVKGLRVEAFASGIEFLEAVVPGVSGCLLIDFELPDIDGLVVLERLRARKIRLPAIMITGYSDDLLRRRAMAAGVVDFVLKPFAVAHVMDRVEAALLGTSERWTAEDDRPVDPDPV